MSKTLTYTKAKGIARSQCLAFTHIDRRQRTEFYISNLELDLNLPISEDPSDEWMSRSVRKKDHGSLYALSVWKDADERRFEGPAVSNQ